jgi:hypothetical protein
VLPITCAARVVAKQNGNDTKWQIHIVGAGQEYT